LRLPMQPDRKRQFFDLGKKALSKVMGIEVPGYACPICLRGFETADELSEEHVPAKSLGGKVLCLTCRHCNSSGGHGVDFQALQEHRSRSFLSPDGSTRRAKIAVGDGDFKINIQIGHDANGYQIQIGKGNNPDALKTLPSEMEKFRVFSIRDSASFRRRDADIAYLKWAYLALFAKFGYTYILGESLKRVHQQIQNPASRVLERTRFFHGSFGESQKAILLIKEPFTCIAVKIHDSMVCLPFFNEDDSFYELLAKPHSEGEKIKLRGVRPIPWPDGFRLSLDLREMDLNETGPN
jgi:HNH endonuclease